MTVKELIEMLKTCDEESIVYIDYNGDINSINKVGTKTTNTTLTCLTGFEVHGQADCVKPENFDLNISAAYAQIEAEDKFGKVLDLFFNGLSMV